MLIVASHAIVSSFLYHQNPSRFITSNVGPTPGTSDRENAEEKHVSQDLTLQLLQCCDVESLGSAIRNGLRSYIPEAYGGALFYVDESNGDVITADNAGLTVCSPTPLCIQQAYGEKQQVILTMESTPACVLDHITNTNGKSYTNQTQVLCYPVLAGQTGTVSAVLAVAIDEITIKVAEKLSWLEKQIAACYSHIQRTFQGRAAEERASQQLIKLCGELYDQDAAKLQLKVIKYLEDQTQAECAFLLLVVPETQELFCQVIGKHILEEEIRFPGQSSSFSVALETKQPLNLDDIPVENRKGIEEVIEIPLRSFLCVPVTSRNDDNLIALACLVNKQNGSRFTDRDVTCIRQCFRYTATVLTSTLAFQNERKIKIQTQALLQVARHLFTNLGELVRHKNTNLDNFPYIKSREWEVNVWGSTIIEALLTNRLDKKFCRSTRKVGNLFSCETVCNGSSICQNCTSQSGGVCYSDRDVGVGYECRNAQDMTEHKQRGKLSRRSTPESSEVYIQENAENDSKVQRNIMKSTASQNKTSPMNKEAVMEIKSDQKRGTKTTMHGEIISKFPDSFDEREQDKAVIVIETTDLAEIGAIEEERPKYDLSFLTPKTSCDLDEESDYVSVYTHDSWNCRNSKLVPDELESIISYQTAADFDDTGDVSLKVNYDNDSDRDIKHLFQKQNSLSYLCACDCKGSDTLVKRGSLDNLEIHGNDDENDTWTHPAKIRLSNSEPFIYAGPSDIFDSRPDLNNAFISCSSDLGTEIPSHGPNTTEKIMKSCKTDTFKVSDDIDEEGLFNGNGGEPAVPDILITLEKVDISDIQAKSTELKSFTQNDLTKLLREVMAQARNLTQAERCSVFLIDDETDELVAKVFDGISTTKDNEVQEEIRLPSTQGIAGHVATSGELLNIKDAYSHPLFYRGIDDSTGFRTRNILCFPIKNEEGKIMGVAQLCNKKTGPFFTQFDEDLATAFGVYCCISISHSLLYKKVIDSQVRNSLANELMMYHMKVSPEDVAGLISVDIPHPRFLHPDFVEFCYAPRTLPESKTLLACLSMFEDLNLISRWRIKRETLARFILMVKKGYRNPPYHNWTHAYTVAQFCYQLVKNMKMEKYLDEIEIYALFVSCLCHDIDHRGTNNSFQTASKSVLAALYSSEGSVLERHHFAQTMCILNTEGCNIFEHLNSREYQQMLDLVRDIILATDLAHHLKILKTIREMAVRGYDRNQVKDHKLLLCLLMTSCDLSDQTKPWDNTKNVAALIYKEFFTQGDMEKASGFQPAEMMDRERAQIPEVQIGFLDHIALPVYKVLSDIFPEGQEISDAVENNKKHWEKIRNLIKLKRGGSCARMTFDEVIAIENESDDTDMEGSSEQLNHSVSNGSG